MRLIALTVCWVVLATASGRTTPNPQTASASASKMTNADVVKLIAAGLSEQVVITAVRQAPNREFDLSPSGLLALKAANVPDAVIVAMQAGPGPVNTRPTTTEGVQSAAQSAQAPKKSVSGFYYRGGKFGDYILLRSTGGFYLAAGGLHDEGTYTVDGSVITFAASAEPGRKHRLLSNPPGSNRIEAGRIVEPDGTFWTDLPPRTTAATPPPVAAAPPVPSNGCSGVELMGLYKEDMQPVAPLIVSLAKIRNGTALTRIVILEWLDMYGQPKRSQTEVKAGEIVSLQLSRNMANERLPINVRLSSCR